MLTIQCLDKINSERYIMSIDERNTSELKYGVLFSYNPVKGEIGCNSQTEKEALLKVCKEYKITGLDIDKMFKTAIENYKERKYKEYQKYLNNLM